MSKKSAKKASKILSSWRKTMPFYYAAALLIVVIVVMDLMAQIQSHLLSHQYEGMMKKANLKGIGGGMR